MARKPTVDANDRVDLLLEATMRMQQSMEPLVPLIEKLVDQNRKAWDALATIHQRAKMMSPEAGEMVAQVLAVMAEVTAHPPAKRANKSPPKKARKKPGTR